MKLRVLLFMLPQFRILLLGPINGVFTIMAMFSSCDKFPLLLFPGARSTRDCGSDLRTPLKPQLTHKRLRGTYETLANLRSKGCGSYFRYAFRLSSSRNRSTHKSASYRADRGISVSQIRLLDRWKSNAF